MYANIFLRNKKLWKKSVIYLKEKKAKHWNDQTFPKNKHHKGHLHSVL